jgi:hypothetical protein
VHAARMDTAGRTTRCGEYDSHGEKNGADAAEEFTVHSFLLTDGDRTGQTFPHRVSALCRTWMSRSPLACLRTDKDEQAKDRQLPGNLAPAPHRSPVGVVRLKAAAAGRHLSITMTFKASLWPAGSELYIANGPLGPQTAVIPQRHYQGCAWAAPGRRRSGQRGALA